MIFEDYLSLIRQTENAAGKPYMGTGGADLSPYILNSVVDQYGFPKWPGIVTSKGISTAAGLYQITRSTWDQYAPVAGVSDFSPSSQTAVAEAILSRSPGGITNWTCCNAALKKALQAAGGIISGPIPKGPAGSGGGTPLGSSWPSDTPFDAFGSIAAPCLQSDSYGNCLSFSERFDPTRLPSTTFGDKVGSAVRAAGDTAADASSPASFAKTLTDFATGSGAAIVLSIVAVLLLLVAIWPSPVRQVVSALK